MKLLPPKQVNERINAEKKANIDAGVFLAKKIDALREEMLTLQRERDKFIAGSQQVISDSLQKLHQQKDFLTKEVKELEVHREELLKPLNQEWITVNETIARVQTEKELNRIDREKLNQDETDIKEKQKKISGILANTRWKEHEIDKARDEAFSLKELARQEYETTKIARENYEKESEKLLSELRSKITTYENGVVLYENKDKDLTKREVALVKEIKHLESQQKQLRLAKKLLK